MPPTHTHSPDQRGRERQRDLQTRHLTTTDNPCALSLSLSLECKLINKCVRFLPNSGSHFYSLTRCLRLEMFAIFSSIIKNTSVTLQANYNLPCLNWNNNDKAISPACARLFVRQNIQRAEKMLVLVGQCASAFCCAPVKRFALRKTSRGKCHVTEVQHIFIGSVGM